MENILSFDKPKKVKSTEKHNKTYQSDSGIAGTYVPNMSDDDMNKWKAKHIKGDDERIEIRKTIEGVQILIVVFKNAYQPKRPKYPSNYDNKEVTLKYKEEQTEWFKRHNNVRISMNGKLDMTWDNFFDMEQAVREAFEILL